MPDRVGANSRDAINPAILRQLNDGEIESATLSEALAVDFSILIGQVAPKLSSRDQHRIAEAKGLGITKRMALAATLLAEQLGVDAAKSLGKHPSDTVRGWAAFIIGNNPQTSLHDKLRATRPLADDDHFGVREWAWLAVRPAIAAQITQAIKELRPWVSSPSERIRRFAIEATRPRGVWSKHIAELKQSPGLAQSLLDGVMDDPSRYVQDACGNWLNDAAKSNPQWVARYCNRWKKNNASSATLYIVKRGLRSLA